MTQHGVIMLLVGALLPSMMETFDILEGSAGIMLGAGALGFIIGPMLSGLLTDRKGVKASYLVGFAAEIVLLAAMGLAPSFYVAVAAFFFLNIAAGFIETSVNIVPALVGNGKSGSLMNIVHVFFSIGAFVSPFLIGLLLVATGSWRPVWLLSIIPTAILLLIVARLRFPRAVKTEHTASAPRPRALQVLRERAILMGAIAMMLYVASEFGASNWITLYLNKELGFATLAATSGLSILWLGLLVGRLINARLALFRASGELVWWSGWGGLVTGLLLLTAQTPMMAYVWLFGLGIFMGGIFPNIMAELNGRNPERTGLITGFLAQSAGLGSLIAQPVLGFVGERAGLGVSMALVAGLMGLVSVVIYLGAGSMAALRHQAPPAEAKAQA
ncbi:MAG: MFS transporter [Anaerolineae bacterium]|jgi:fucose permease|nr:MFS transporter [Anaerolineae bacterium]